MARDNNSLYEGIKGIGNSNFDYDKLRLSVYRRLRFGPLGVGYFNLTAEKVFATLPYPLMALHLGNQTPLFTSVTYNMMNYGEFISDRFASLQYQHRFEGFLLNRIPLMRKLKWRLVGTANVIYGGLSQANRDIIAPTTPYGEPTLPFGILILIDPMSSWVMGWKIFLNSSGWILFTGSRTWRIRIFENLLCSLVSNSVYKSW